MSQIEPKELSSEQWNVFQKSRVSWGQERIDQLLAHIAYLERELAIAQNLGARSDNQP